MHWQEEHLSIMGETLYTSPMMLAWNACIFETACVGYDVVDHVAVQTVLQVACIAGVLSLRVMALQVTIQVEQ